PAANDLHALSLADRRGKALSKIARDLCPRRRRENHHGTPPSHTSHRRRPVSPRKRPHRPRQAAHRQLPQAIEEVVISTEAPRFCGAKWRDRSICFSLCEPRCPLRQAFAVAFPRTLAVLRYT